MPKIAVPLNDKQIQNSKPKDKTYYLMDAKGLYLIIAPKGGKWWRFKYTFENKSQTLSLGTYPIVSLVEAREMALKLKKEIKQGIKSITPKKRSQRDYQSPRDKKTKTHFKPYPKND
jgi:hypothetical protein